MSFIFIYLTTKNKECRLEAEFGEEYSKYKNNTPAFIPNISCCLPKFTFPTFRLPVFQLPQFMKRKVTNDESEQHTDQAADDQTEDWLTSPRRSARPKKVRVKKSE